MPLPTEVVVVGFLVVVVAGVPPITPTQTLTSAHKPELSLLTEGSRRERTGSGHEERGSRNGSGGEGVDAKRV